MNVIIFGPQGSGKGTQAEALSKKLNIPQITMGDLFRDEVKEKSRVGQKIESIINQGNLVDDELTLEVLKKRLEQPDCQNGFILDGYPRTLNQAKMLDDIASIDKALEIWISDEESVRRIGGRRSCPKCGAVYHLEYKPPKEEAKCDQCVESLIIRDDDKEKVIKKRLQAYHQQTEPLIEYYQNQGKHIKIDGMPPIPEVTKQINEEIK